MHRRTGFCTIVHQLCYCPGSHSNPRPRSCSPPPLLCLWCTPSPPPECYSSSLIGYFLFDVALKVAVNPFPSGNRSGFVSSHFPIKNSTRDNLTGKGGYGYGNGRQYCGSFGTVHCSCAPCYSLLGGIPTKILPQSCKGNYTGWYNIVGNIYTSGFSGIYFTSFLLLL